MYRYFTKSSVGCRFELALEAQRWTRARSECLPGGWGKNYSYATERNHSSDNIIVRYDGVASVLVGMSVAGTASVCRQLRGAGTTRGRATGPLLPQETRRTEILPHHRSLNGVIIIIIIIIIIVISCLIFSCLQALCWWAKKNNNNNCMD